jgi:O-antigen/teichoic acid export membrane protein
LSDDYTGIMRKTARSSMVLIAGQVASTLILAAAQILIAGMLGQDRLGDYTVVFVPVSIAILVQDFGVSTGLTSYIAKFQGAEHSLRRKNIVAAGLAFNFIISLLITCVVFLLTPFLASNFLQRVDLEFMLRVASFSVLGNCFYTTTNAIFIGHGRMELQALNVVVFAIVRSLLSPLLIYLGYSTLGAVLGHAATIILTGLMGLFMALTLIREIEGKLMAPELWGELKGLLRYGLPVYMSNLVGGGLNQFYSSLMVLYVVNTQIGNYTAAVNFATLVNFVTGSIALAIFPIFSRLNRGDPNLSLMYRSAVKYSSFVAMPIVGMLISLSGPVIAVLFGDRFPLTAFYLQLYMLVFIYIGLGSVATGQLLNGQGETRINLRCSLITLVTGGSIALLLAPRFGMVGLIVTLIVSPLPGILYGLRWIKGNLGVGPDCRSSVKIYFCVVVSAVPTALIAFMQVNVWLKLVGGAGVFMFVYFASTKLLHVFGKGDYATLRAILGDGEGLFSRVGNRLIDLLQ